MLMQPVVSTNVRAFAYDISTMVMRVEFISGGVYDYYGVDAAVADQMLLPYPWRRVGRKILASYRCEKVA